MEKCLAKPKAKLLPTPNKDTTAAKPYSKILEEHKSRSRGKWGELAGARAGCGIEAPHQGKILPAKVLVIPAMETQQSLLAGGCRLSTHLLQGGRLPQAEGSGGTDSLPFFIHRWRPASLPETEAGAAQG